MAAWTLGLGHLRALLRGGGVGDGREGRGCEAVEKRAGERRS